MRELLERLETKLSVKSVSDSELTLQFKIGPHDRAGEIYFVETSDPKKSCRRNVSNLRRNGYEADRIFTVGMSDVDIAYRGKGYGKIMYRDGFRMLVNKFGPVYVTPDSCNFTGVTSTEAKRVWNKLKSEYPSSGLVFYVS